VIGLVFLGGGRDRMGMRKTFFLSHFVMGYPEQTDMHFVCSVPANKVHSCN
jgi:hypothetical protein